MKWSLLQLAALLSLCVTGCGPGMRTQLPILALALACGSAHPQPHIAAAPEQPEIVPMDVREQRAQPSPLSKAEFEQALRREFARMGVPFVKCGERDAGPCDGEMRGTIR